MNKSIHQTIYFLPSYSDSLAAMLPLSIRFCCSLSHATMMMHAVVPRKLNFPSLAVFIGAAGY